MRWRILCLLLLSALPVLSFSVDGQWAATVPFGAGTAEIILELHSDGDRLTGSLAYPYAKLTISEGRVSVDKISFETVQAGNGGVTVRMLYSGVVSDDELRLTASMEGKSGESLVLRRRDPDTPSRNPFAEDPAPQKVVDWLKAHALTIDTVEPGHGYADLETLKSHIADTRVVALGEATHGTREFFQMKHRLLEFLVTEMGFTVFAIEANWAEALAINDYVLNGEGDATAALGGLHFWTWHTEETLAMIEWMWEWNRAHERKVKFYGFDMQYPAVALDKALQYLRTVDETAATGLGPRLAELAAPRSVRDYPTASSQVHDATRAALSELAKILDEHRTEYVADTSDAAWQVARQHARIASQAEEKLRLPFEQGSKARDRWMAENVRWILDREPAGTKIVLWAHNGHVAASTGEREETMGFHLRRMFGDQLLIAGFAFGEGSFQARDSAGPVREFSLGPPPEGSLDDTLKRAGLPLFAIDLRDRPADGGVREWLDMPHFSRQIGASFSDSTTWHHLPIEAPAQFDLLIFVAKTTRARSL